LLDTLPGAVEFLTVIAATNAVVLNPTDGELQPAVGALKSDDVGGATLAAIERKILAHDFDWLGPTGLQVIGPVNRMPKQTHVTCGTGPCSRPYRLLEVEKNAIAMPLGKSNFVSQAGRFDSLDGANLILIRSAAADSYRADNFVTIHD
jgi:hypothetical protein